MNGESKVPEAREHDVSVYENARMSMGWVVHVGTKQDYNLYR